MIVFWDISISLIVDAARSSEISATFFVCMEPYYRGLHTRCRENLKSHNINICVGEVGLDEGG
jgi:hypothetical protein